MNISEIFKNRDNVENIDLEKLHTKQLLKLKIMANSDTYDWYSNDATEIEYYAKLQCFIDKVKLVLATREHILNKKESKAIRKAKIKKGV